MAHSEDLIADARHLKAVHTSLSNHKYLEAASAARSLADRVQNLSDAVILDWRETGASWAEIALAFGITRQAAQQRHVTAVKRRSN